MTQSEISAALRAKGLGDLATAVDELLIDDSHEPPDFSGPPPTDPLTRIAWDMAKRRNEQFIAHKVFPSEQEMRDDMDRRGNP
jgi:hypothetical protein